MCLDTKCIFIICSGLLQHPQILPALFNILPHIPQMIGKHHRYTCSAQQSCQQLSNLERRVFSVLVRICLRFSQHSEHSSTLCLTWQLTFRSLWMNFLTKIKQPFDFSCKPSKPSAAQCTFDLKDKLCFLNTPSISFIKQETQNIYMKYVYCVISYF